MGARMKNLFILAALFCTAAFAGPDDVQMVRRNSADNGNITTFPTHPSTVGLYQYDPSILTPGWATLGSGLTMTSNVLDVTNPPVNADWNSVSGLSQILNKPTIPTVSTPSQSSATRTLNSIFQVSATRGAFVFYSVQITVTASIAGGQDGDCILEIASDSGFTTNVQTLMVSPSSQTYTLAIALQGVQKGPVNVSGYIPAGYYARIRTVNNTGTPAFLYRAGQEVLM